MESSHSLKVGEACSLCAVYCPCCKSRMGDRVADLSIEFVKAATRDTGAWALNFLALTLLITPLGKLFHLAELFRFRRMLGVFSFFYACLHLFVWSQVHHMPGIRTFNPWNLRIAFVGFALMILLAVTSTTASMRWLGGKRWRMLHSLVYVSSVTTVVHYCGLATDFTKPMIYGLIFGLLLAFRIIPNAIRSFGAKEVEVPAPQSMSPTRGNAG